jgi:hypothetical protein
MHLAPLVRARESVPRRIGWCTLFTKAYAIVAQVRPELRRTYLGLPWPHLYEHPGNIASVAVSRWVGAEEALFFVHLREPQEQPLAQLDDHLKRYKSAPLEEIAVFRRVLDTGWVPGPLRRLLWWWGLNGNGLRKARHLGTFGVSSVAAEGASSLHLLTPITTALNYGVVEENGSVDVRLTFDHRVVDGLPVARALVHLEEVLNTRIVQELNGLAGKRTAQSVADARPGKRAARSREASGTAG